jgi:hypothetical protein
MAKSMASNYYLPAVNRYQEISPTYTPYYHPANASIAPRK